MPLTQLNATNVIGLQPFFVVSQLANAQYTYYKPTHTAHVHTFKLFANAVNEKDH